MKALLLFFLPALPLVSTPAFAENISDRLIAAVVEKNLPAVLYEHTDKPWQMGTYNLRINKSGITSFTSSDSLLKLSLPIEAIVKGKLRQNLMGKSFAMNCNSQFLSNGRIDVAPKLSAEGYRATVSITVPIPETDMNCDGLMIPIKPLLEQLVAENKGSWERDLEKDINQLFQQVGI